MSLPEGCNLQLYLYTFDRIAGRDWVQHGFVKSSKRSQDAWDLWYALACIILQRRLAISTNFTYGNVVGCTDSHSVSRHCQAEQIVFLTLYASGFKMPYQSQEYSDHDNIIEHNLWLRFKRPSSACLSGWSNWSETFATFGILNDKNLQKVKGCKKWSRAYHTNGSRHLSSPGDEQLQLSIFKIRRLWKCANAPSLLCIVSRPILAWEVLYFQLDEESDILVICDKLVPLSALSCFKWAAWPDQYNSCSPTQSSNAKGKWSCPTTLWLENLNNVAWGTGIACNQTIWDQSFWRSAFYRSLTVMASLWKLMTK